MTFLNGPLKEEVYVAQPDGFVDPDHPKKVYRLRKALYGLKQAPRTWYDKLSKFLTSKGFTKGTIDPTLFTIRYGEDILLVQIYVDDIIFGSTNPKYTKCFEKLMHSRFEMSLMGEMKFFLRLQVHQFPCGIFINKAKYALEILHKHGMDKGQSIGTPMATKPKLDADLSGNPVDQTYYRSKTRSLMYLTSSRPDIVQANRTAMSSAEAEYVALSASCAQVMWMRTQLQDYGFNYNKIPLYYGERKTRKEQNRNKTGQIKKKTRSVEKPGNAQGQSQSRKQKREEKYKLNGPNMQILEVVLNSRTIQGLKVQFTQSSTTRGNSTKYPKLLKERTRDEISHITLRG
nr:retrovirus-related Pol polyprotein from transposon TNT 1-94 [Tanacetum cinerariifolium]